MRALRLPLAVLALAALLVLALLFLVAAKGANVSVPILLKYLVDALDLKPGEGEKAPRGSTVTIYLV